MKKDCGNSTVADLGFLAIKKIDEYIKKCVSIEYGLNYNIIIYNYKF